VPSATPAPRPGEQFAVRQGARLRRRRQAELRVYLGDPTCPSTPTTWSAPAGDPDGAKELVVLLDRSRAKHVGIIQSLLTTCRLQGVDPYTYLVDVLQRVSLHPPARSRT